MRLVTVFLLSACLLGLVSCAADMPTAPGRMTYVAGTILDREGLPVEDAQIYLEQRGAGQVPSLVSARTDADGAFSLEAREGTYRLYLNPPYERGLPYVRIETFEVSEEGTRFDYRYTGTLVSGTATGPGGDPMAAFQVSALAVDTYRMTSAPGQNGAYSLLLSPGRYEFFAEPGYDTGSPRYSFDVTVTEQDTTIDLDFSGSEITVHLTLFGVPVPQIRVDAEGSRVSGSAFTDIDGNARLYLPPGGYSLIVDTQISGITGPERRYVDIQGDGTVPFDLTGVRWNVTVRWSGNLQPMPQAEVYFYEIGGSRWGGTRTDQNGRLTMVVQPNWGHEVRVIPAGSTSAYTVNHVASSADSTFDLVVPVPAP